MNDCERRQEDIAIGGVGARSWSVGFRFFSGCGVSEIWRSGTLRELYTSQAVQLFPGASQPRPSKALVAQVRKGPSESGPSDCLGRCFLLVP